MHTHCLFAYRFPLPREFFQARHAGRRLSATHSRLVPRLVLSRLEGRLVHISDCQFLPYSLYRPVGPCSLGLARFASSFGVTIATLTSSHISIVFSYHCILVSFIYIAYIIFIIYIHRRDTMSHATISKQAVAVPPPVPPASNRMSGTRQER